ncbi:uncharacterized protein [Atheta coriaria]|uniref:uncharacterized protein isoform X2 n=1 Tax=Dalotia coriaria TaxID=877792 RepID=UPI0031F362B2
MNEQYHYHHQNQKAEYTDSQNAQFDDVIIRRSNEIIIARANVELYNAMYGDRHWNLVDPIWQREVSRNLIYKIDKPYFHILFVKKELHGLNFADLTEAEMFFYAMERLWPFRNFSKMISKFTTRFANFFSRKRVPPMPTISRNQHFQIVDTKPPSSFGENQFYRDEVPTRMTVFNGAGINTQDQHLNYAYDYSDAEQSHYGNQKIVSGRVPKPPPLPPPVMGFSYASSNDRMGRNCNGLNTNTKNSFEAQIKHEARKHNSAIQNLFKYLP